MNYNELNKALFDCADVKIEKIKNTTIEVKDFPFIKLRNIFIESGTIHQEDFQNHIYIAVVKSGAGNRNPAWIAAYCGEDNIMLAVYAKEGLINQHTSDKVIERVRSEVVKAVKD